MESDKHIPKIDIIDIDDDCPTVKPTLPPEPCGCRSWRGMTLVCGKHSTAAPNQTLTIAQFPSALDWRPVDEQPTTAATAPKSPQDAPADPGTVDSPSGHGDAPTGQPGGKDEP